ncbi:type VII secretion protein EccB [Miniimonas arenae]|uniref:Type VII secretion protein EccB n=1 Tax=Miniimonas arenae TaxID=676201 RepID=A0A5C5BFB5_9MICO|nr:MULTISPECIES: type VII secretion protein EccB [Miniimonas]TNU76280.1 type VII secretion protein EccB [Miniimonas arenae]
MASKKELLEAQSFARRRLLTAFTSGAPGGRELEPTTPVRGLVTGVVLAALVVGGSFVAGLFDQGLESGWENGKIILVRDNAARYVSADGELVPVPNMASARLLAPAGAEILTVPADDVADVHRRPVVGIAGAPDSLPEVADLVTGGWLACVAQDGTTATSVVDSPAPEQGGPNSPSALVAVVAGEERSLFLVQDGRRYAVPGTATTDGVLRALGYTPQDAVTVDARWLELFPEGGAATPFTVADAGTTPPGDLADVPGVVVGSVIEVSGQAFVVLPDGALARLDPFADALYSAGPGGLLSRESVEPARVAGVQEVAVADGPVDATWPVVIADPLESGAAPCARLDTETFGSDLVAGEPVATGGIAVAPARGALALFVATADSASGPVRFIDENGISFPVVASSVDLTDTLERLLGEGADPVRVPYAWGDLFPTGPTLSVDAAGTPLAAGGAAATPTEQP